MMAVKWRLDIVFRVLPFLMFPVICGLKYGTCWINIALVKQMFTHMKSDWNVLQSEKEIQVMAKYAGIGYLFGKFYAVFIFSAVLGFITLSFVPLVLDIVIPLNVSRVQMLYLEDEHSTDMDEHSYLILLHLQSVTVAGGTAAAAADILTISMSFHACGMYNVIRYRLEHLFDDCENFSSSRKVTAFRTRMIHAVDYHWKCMEHLKLLKACFLVSYVAQLFVVIIAIASLLANIQAYLMSNKYLLATICSFDLLGHWILVFLVIWPSQRIADYSSDLTYST
ncbi:hypothetical protein KM043_007903 [Ampulex compressa]|nr:hypothetical protein KM043_007903 [Ampulex compressa]